MCMGMPCISTDCSPGGARELLGNERGLVVPCGNREKLADAIDMYFDKTDDALQYG